jgi:hypothetical protein
MNGAARIILAVTIAASANVRASADPDARVLSPGPPFPVVIAASVERAAIAPGVTRSTYRLRTAAGPLVAQVVTVDLHDPRVHVATVLAHDTVVSSDERLSSMARRTHAVAGINGDYFDINATGAPVGILVRDGELLRSPSARPAIVIDDAGGISFERLDYTGSVTTATEIVPLSALNVWPARGTASLLTPAFGASAAPAGVTILSLAQLDADPNTGRYRVVDAVGATSATPQLRIAAGAGMLPMPIAAVGDSVIVASTTTPPLERIRSAIGGGAILLRDGIAVDDPASPNYATRARRIPCAAAARLADGKLALVTVDGHRAVTSIGVSRSELTSLLIALGATDALLLDSGGSATLVAREPGDADASVINDPSDGVERPVADGLFAYSDTPIGPPAQLVLTPHAIVALAGAHVPLRSRVVDASGHALRDAAGPWRVGADAGVAAIDSDGVLHAGDRVGARVIPISRDGVRTELPLEIVARVARIVVGPQQIDPDPRAAVQLTASAYDDRDRPVAIDGVVQWSATGATIDHRGHLIAGEGNAQVTATAGGVRTTVTIPVGRHSAALALTGTRPIPWTLVTVPAGGPGAVSADDHGLHIAYDFRASERAAYAIGDLAIGAPLALSCAVDGDGNGEALRATLVDRYGDRETATFVRTLDFSETRRLSIAIGPSLAPPIVLHALYAVGSLATPPVRARGALLVHDCTTTVAGTEAR